MRTLHCLILANGACPNLVGISFHGFPDQDIVSTIPMGNMSRDLNTVHYSASASQITMYNLSFVNHCSISILCQMLMLLNKSSQCRLLEGLLTCSVPLVRASFFHGVSTPYLSIVMI